MAKKADVFVAIVFLSWRAHAGPLGDATVGAGADEHGAAVRAGVRGGFASGNVAGLLGVDWVHPVGDDPEDVYVSEHRARVLASVALPYELAPHALLMARLGGGIDFVHLRECSALNGRCQTETSRGYVLEVAPMLLHRGPLYVGAELVLGLSSDRGWGAAVSFVVRAGS